MFGQGRKSPSRGEQQQLTTIKTYVQLTDTSDIQLSGHQYQGLLEQGPAQDYTSETEESLHPYLRTWPFLEESSRHITPVWGLFLADTS